MTCLHALPSLQGRHHSICLDDGHGKRRGNGGPSGCFQPSTARRSRVVPGPFASEIASLPVYWGGPGGASLFFLLL
jgi:hypothetical protein